MAGTIAAADEEKKKLQHLCDERADALKTSEAQRQQLQESINSAKQQAADESQVLQ